jgi:flagellar hook-associated protein FlgK
MSDMLSIGSSGVQVYQRALATVSNNIANAATEGYSRQEAVLVDNDPRLYGGLWFGTGARADSIQRQFDAFLEQGLRTSISDVETQAPLIDYTDRVVDIVGSQRTGLSGSLESFFAAARRLSTDAASPELRMGFLSEAEGLTARLKTLSGQLDSIAIETDEAVKVNVGKINTLTEQLALVNAELNRRNTVDQQAPKLLDHRDSLLRELAGLARIRVKEYRSGVVDVSLGPTDNQGRIVEGNEWRQVDAVLDERTLGVKIIVDPRGDYEVVSGVNSGTLGGILNFRDQILAPSMAQLDYIAQTIASQFNATHELGVDSTGKLGGPLFTIDPVFELKAEASSARLAIQWEVTDPALTKFNSIDLRYDPNVNRWTATDVVTGESVSGTEELALNGMLIRINGRSDKIEEMRLEASNRPATGIRRLIEDPRMVAAAAPFRVIENPLNESGADALVAWLPDQDDESTVRSLASLPLSTPWQRQPTAVENSASRPASLVGRVPAGFSDTSFTLSSAIAQPMDVQVFTRDGRHIAGRSLSQGEIDALVTEDTGFTRDATYSTLYLNETDTDGYLGLEVFRGARTKPSVVDVLNYEGKVIGTETVPARLQTARIPEQALAVGEALFAAGALALNGQNLGEFIPTTRPIKATEVSAWFSSEINRTGLSAKLQARALNEVKASADVIDLSKPLEINGEVVWAATGPAPRGVEGLAQLINARSSTTGVIASVDTEGALVLTNVAGQEGEDISLGPADDWVDGRSGNALGLAAGRYAGRLELSAKNASDSVELAIGAAGNPSALSRLGLDTSVQIDGEIPEDLLVFVTGEGSASFSTLFTEGKREPIDFLRDRELEVSFVTDTRWKLTDKATGTILAERDYRPLEGIHYRGLQVNLSRVPSEGDVFTIDGNQDGIGDNANILRLAALESSRELIAGGVTIGEAWLEQLNRIGNLGNQARIAEEALKVVNEQAVEARDQVSGVSLDEEAADLIRFQQAYQASAKVIQLANQLFDAIAQIR